MSDSTFGQISHVEIPAPDLDKAIKFYQDIFGWQIEKIPGMNYAMYTTGSVGGGFDPSLEVSDAGVNIVISVDSIEQSLKDIEEAGGVTVTPKTEIEGGFGFYACFKDPNGNRLSVHCRA